MSTLEMWHWLTLSYSRLLLLLDSTFALRVCFTVVRMRKFLLSSSPSIRSLPSKVSIRVDRAKKEFENLKVALEEAQKAIELERKGREETQKLMKLEWEGREEASNNIRELQAELTGKKEEFSASKMKNKAKDLKDYMPAVELQVVESFCAQEAPLAKINNAYVVGFFKCQKLALQQLGNLEGLELPSDAGVTPELEAKILEKR
ncbi:hypothetical protein LguiA_009817 [Lonicera macranthoides]